MRRIGLIILAWAGLMALAPAPSLAAPPQTLAPHALLVEAETGSVLFEKQADDLVAPASLAKLMTVSVVFEQLELGNVKLDDAFVISENAWRKGGAGTDGSRSKGRRAPRRERRRHPRRAPPPGRGSE